MMPCCAISFDESTLGRLGSNCAQREQDQDDVADASARVADNERTSTRGGQERWTGTMDTNDGQSKQLSSAEHSNAIEEQHKKVDRRLLPHLDHESLFAADWPAI